MPYYNLNGLEDMAQGNVEFINNMINVFLEHTPPILDELNECYSKGELKKVGEIAHQIKPSIDLMGIEKLYEDIRILEKKGKEDVIDGMGEVINQVNMVLKDVFQTLKPLS